MNNDFAVLQHSKTLLLLFALTERRGAKSDLVPLHRVALPLKPVLQRAARVQEEGPERDEPPSRHPRWPRHCPLQVSVIVGDITAVIMVDPELLNE